MKATQIEIKDYPKRKLAYVSHTGPYKGDTALFGRLFTKVLSWAEPKGVMNDPTMETITVYHDSNAVPEEKQRISVGYTVPADTTVDGEIKAMDLPEHSFLVGSFEILPHEYGEAWGYMFDYVREKELKPSYNLMYESYQNDPSSHPEGKHIVDICIALND